MGTAPLRRIDVDLRNGAAPDTVYVIPLVRGRMRMTWCEQPGTAPTIGFFGGRVEAGESTVDTARRELLEEAGLLAGELRHWFSTRLSPKIAWTSHVYVASRCAETKPESDPGERFLPIDVNFDQLLRAAARDNFAHADFTAPLLRIASDPGRAQVARAFIAQG